MGTNGSSAEGYKSSQRGPRNSAGLWQFQTGPLETAKDRRDFAGHAAKTCILLPKTRLFPFVSDWEISRGDLMLLGSNERLPVDFSTFQQRMSQPGVKADLERIDLFRLRSRRFASLSLRGTSGERGGERGN